MKRKKISSKKKLEKLLDVEWSSYIRSRDKICQRCHKSTNISAHHAFGRRHLSTRWDVENGVSLCMPCHLFWAHRDICSFAEWFRLYVGVDQYNRLNEAHRIIYKPLIDELQSKLEVLRSMK
jgi:hypothetical protein